MSARAKASDWNYAVDGVRSRLRREQSTGHLATQWLEGTVTTPFGYVYAYSQWTDGTRLDDHASVDIVWHGRRYVRSWERAFKSERGLATVAGRFAREIAGGGR